jgi:hypothetical protein
MLSKPNVCLQVLIRTRTHPIKRLSILFRLRLQKWHPLAPLLLDHLTERQHPTTYRLEVISIKAYQASGVM